MELKRFLAEKLVILSSATTKTEVLTELSEVMAKDVGLSSEDLLKAVLAREKLMSTGIGQGLAVPHVRLSTLKKPAIAVAVIREGVSDYVSLDASPVHIIILIAAPQGQHETYVRLLAQTVDVLKSEDVRQAIIDATTPLVVYEKLTGAE